MRFADAYVSDAVVTDLLFSRVYGGCCSVWGKAEEREGEEKKRILLRRWDAACLEEGCIFDMKLGMSLGELGPARAARGAELGSS